MKTFLITILFTASLQAVFALMSLTFMKLPRTVTVDRSDFAFRVLSGIGFALWAWSLLP